MEVAPRYVTISFEVQDGKLESLLNRKLRPAQVGVNLIQQMIRELNRMDAYSMDMIATQLTQLLLMLQRNHEPTTKLMASNALNSENEIICRAQQYISAHIREKLSVPLVAKMVDVSPSYMTALFHKNLQISPGEYIRRVKIQESKQMIREGNMNFTQIAATLHYSTVHHFSRQFKDKVGFTPTEYAKSVR
jgi:AraC-like DNA-binding protein